MTKRIKPLTPAEKALSDLKRAKAAEDIAKSFKRRGIVAPKSVTITNSSPSSSETSPAAPTTTKTKKNKKP